MKKFKKIETEIKGLIIIEPQFHGDTRGFFIESYSKREFEKLGIVEDFVQDNHSKSKKGVLRGLHFQKKNAQAKLVRVIKGKILDVVVDLRRESISFGKWFSLELSEVNRKMLYIPEGFAHGFLALEDDTEVQYKCNNYYEPNLEAGIRWNDEDLKIDWQFEKYKITYKDITLSEKDKKQQSFKEYYDTDNWS